MFSIDWLIWWYHTVLVPYLSLSWSLSYVDYRLSMSKFFFRIPLCNKTLNMFVSFLVIWTTGKVWHTSYLFNIFFWLHYPLPHDSCCMLFPPLFESNVTEKWLAIQWGNLMIQTANSQSFTWLIGVFCSIIQHFSLRHICCSIQKMLVQDDVGFKYGSPFPPEDKKKRKVMAVFLAILNLYRTVYILQFWE